MLTIQSLSLLNAVTAISAFSTSAKEAFEDFLKNSSSRYCIFREKRTNIILQVKDNSRELKTQFDYSQHYYALEEFRYDAKRDLLLALTSENQLKK